MAGNLCCMLLLLPPGSFCQHMGVCEHVVVGGHAGECQPLYTEEEHTTLREPMDQCTLNLSDPQTHKARTELLLTLCVGLLQYSAHIHTLVSNSDDTLASCRYRSIPAIGQCVIFSPCQIFATTGDRRWIEHFNPALLFTLLFLFSFPTLMLIPQLRHRHTQNSKSNIMFAQYHLLTR